MLRPILFMSAGILLVSWSASDAQDTNSTEQSSTLTAAKETTPDIPDGLAFSLSITNLLGLIEGDSDFGKAWVQEHFAVDEMEAEELIGLFHEAAYEIETDIQASTKEIGCVSGVPRVYDENTYVAFEQMGDARDAIAESHYVRVKSQIDADVADRLEAWVENQKHNIGYSKTDHRELSRRTGRDGNQRLQKLCQRMNSQSGGT